MSGALLTATWNCGDFGMLIGFLLSLFLAARRFWREDEKIPMIDIRMIMVQGFTLGLLFGLLLFRIMMTTGYVGATSGKG